MEVISSILARVKARANEKTESTVKASHGPKHRPVKLYDQDMLEMAHTRVNYERAVRLAEADMVTQS